MTQKVFVVNESGCQGIGVAVIGEPQTGKSKRAKRRARAMGNRKLSKAQRKKMNR